MESTREDEEDEEDAGAAGSLSAADADGAEHDKVELLELELAADAIPNGGESETPRGKSGGEELDADAHASGMSSSDSRGELASSRTVEGERSRAKSRANEKPTRGGTDASKVQQ